MSDVELRELGADEVENRRRKAGLPVDGEPAESVRSRGTGRVEVSAVDARTMRDKRRKAGLTPEPPATRPTGSTGVQYAGPADERPEPKEQPRRGRRAERKTDRRGGGA